MPPKNSRLALQCKVSVSWHFLKTLDTKKALKGKVAANTPRKSFTGTVKAIESLEDGNVMCDIELDDLKGQIFKVPGTKLKYDGPKSRARATRRTSRVIQQTTVFEEDQQENDEEEELDTSAAGPYSVSEVGVSATAPTIATAQANSEDDWNEGPLEVDARLTSSNGSYRGKASFNLPNYATASPSDYFLYFLPIEFIQTRVLTNINTHGMSVEANWRNVTYLEYLTWITLFLNMTVLMHVDKRAYWHKGSSHLFPIIHFTEYLDMKRFNLITQFHIFELPSAAKEEKTHSTRFEISWLNSTKHWQSRSTQACTFV